MGHKISKGFIHELRRRRVFNTVALYVVGAWVALQAVELALPGLHIPDFAIRYAWITAFLLFPLVLVIGWRYDITKQGIVRTPPADADDRFDHSLRRTDHFILALLLVGAIGIFYQFVIWISETRYQESTEIAGKDIQPNSIAVLPLENLSGDPEQAYFVSGMQDALIAGLSRISALKVISKTSTLRYRNTHEPLPRIAAQLGVARLIEGSIFRVGDRVRITVNLMNALSDEHIWSETFEKDISDVLSLQNEVAQAIARQVEVSVTPAEQARLERDKPIDPRAYEALLKGQFHIELFTPQDMQLAQQYFQRAMELDPGSALALVGLAKLWQFQAQAGLITPEIARQRCLPLIEKALELDDSSPEAWFIYAAHMTWLRYDWEDADKAFQRAIELNPSYAEARVFYSHFLTILGRAGEGTEQMRIGLTLDPLNPFFQALHGVQLLMTGDVSGSIRVLEDAKSSAPGSGFPHDVLAMAYDRLGEGEHAISAIADSFRLSMNDPETALALEDIYRDNGYSDAMRYAANVLETRSQTAYVTPVGIAWLYAMAGDYERAIDFYEMGYRIGEPNLPYLGAIAKSEVQTNPRFIKLLKDMKLDYWVEHFSKSGEQ